MKVILGLFNNKVDTGNSIRYVGTKEHFEEVIKNSTKMYDGKLPITLAAPIQGEMEDVRDYHNRVMSVDKRKVVGMVSNFEVIEIPQDYIFNQLLLTAEVNIDSRFGDTNYSIGIRGIMASMTVQDVIFGDIKCDYKIDRALSKIICFDLEDKKSTHSTVEDFISALYAFQPIDKEEALSEFDVMLHPNNVNLEPTMDSMQNPDELSPQVTYDELFGKDKEEEEDTFPPESFFKVKKRTINE